ncbi:MAG: ferric reductase-like transmembrane domain-containing protein [Sciscionella sp.]|nr:ferric reductase-like transmembrane domain-containing protein [Sciscionella sp.]
MATHSLATHPPAGRRAPHTAHLAVRLLLLCGGLAVGGLWWVDTAATSLNTPGGVATAAGRVAGLVGAYLVLVQLMLLARLPWFERAVGLDRLAAWHRGLGTNVVLLLCAHVLLIVAGISLTEHSTAWSAVGEVLTGYPDTLLALIGMVLFLAVAVSSARFLRRRLSYEAWYWLHLTTYIAVALSFFHQISAGADFVVNGLAKSAWIAMYVLVAASVLWWRLVLPVRRWFRHALVVDRVVRETPDTVSVWLRGHRLDELAARPGQFFLWRFVTAGHLWSAHPYSLSAPLIRGQWLRITVKDSGNHSGRLARLHRGVPVFAEGPFGHFTSAKRRRGRVLLIAGGVGITPIRALAEDLVGGGGDITLLYRASSWPEVALRAEIDALATLGLRVRYLVGRRRDLRADPLGPQYLRRLVPDVARRDVFVCGPPAMTATVLATLRRLNVPRAQIHTEEFSLR